jgi:exosortase/archaeosortase family protein
MRLSVLAWILRIAVLWFALSILAHAATLRWHLTDHVARALAHTLRAMGAPAAVTGSTVLVGRFRIEIIEECTGLSLAAALVAFALVLPATWKRRAAGAALLFLAAEAWNVIRLIALSLIGWRWPGSIPFLHDVLWQVATVVFVLGAAAAWARAVLPRRS